jgi:hypothetical protein
MPWREELVLLVPNPRPILAAQFSNPYAYLSDGFTNTRIDRVRLLHIEAIPGN